MQVNFSVIEEDYGKYIFKEGDGFGGMFGGMFVGEVYEGELLNGKPDGKGVISCKDGERYEL